MSADSTSLRTPNRNPLRRRIGPFRLGYYLVGAMFAVYLFVVAAPLSGTFGIDAFAYWSASPPLYASEAGDFGAFLYSPAFYQIVAQTQFLDWTAFVWLWAALNVGTAVWLGPMALAFPFTWIEIYHGNIHLLLAAAIVLGFRYPAAWAFVLLTKVTPGVGLLWFAVRREWRALAVALAVTAIVATVSFALAPRLWFDWALMLAGSGQDPLAFGPPLLARLPIAALVVIWGARTDRRWTVPLAAYLALPNLWWHGLAVLAAIPLSRARTRSQE